MKSKKSAGKGKNGNEKTAELGKQQKNRKNVAFCVCFSAVFWYADGIQYMKVNRGSPDFWEEREMKQPRPDCQRKAKRNTGTNWLIAGIIAIGIFGCSLGFFFPFWVNLAWEMRGGQERMQSRAQSLLDAFSEKSYHMDDESLEQLSEANEIARRLVKRGETGDREMAEKVWETTYKAAEELVQQGCRDAKNSSYHYEQALEFFRLIKGLGYRDTGKYINILEMVTSNASREEKRAFLELYSDFPPSRDILYSDAMWY